MKLLTLIYSIIIIVTSSSNDRTRSNPQMVRADESTSKVQMLDDHWPFKDTLSHSDPFISELLVKEN